jgi:hypothetical protein
MLALLDAQMVHNINPFSVILPTPMADVKSDKRLSVGAGTIKT